MFIGASYNISSFNASSLYVVYVQSLNTVTSTYDPTSNTFTNTTNLGLYYCGLARNWNDTCLNSKFVCTAPGPMFYLPVDEEITIIWVNNITSNGTVWDESECYSSDSLDEDCMIDAKITRPYMPQTEGCTFNKPTDYGYSTRKVRVNKNQVPISPHIHGL